MMDRRTFTSLLAGGLAGPSLSAGLSWGQAMKKTVFFSSVGPDLTLYEIDMEGAALTKRNTVTLPANIQYAWPHPSRQYFYVVSSNGGPGAAGDKHTANAFRLDPASGALTPHGQPQSLPSRPIHTSVDLAGEYLLTPTTRRVRSPCIASRATELWGPGLSNPTSSTPASMRIRSVPRRIMRASSW
jgi:6-phosphogluconolactonase